MAAKKYGTFDAVYLPSLLAIVGAIMYLRLGWVVGQGGLYKTLLIIFIAHIISFTTGLCVSSIATDKKIHNGGIYYILSRSLGLPMGGAIGIAISLGMILTIALQVVAFSESLLSVPAIANFLHLVPCAASFRIIGSVSLFIVFIVALISTSSAVKSQYFFLAAIFISLISIILGFFVNTNYHPITPNFQADTNSNVPFMVLFGIFFPAVTGFTTGVAMSGDLKNPKKAIPIGVLGSITTGLIVYICLTIGFSLFVDRSLLLTDTNFLSKIAWNPALVYLGIWCATLPTSLVFLLSAPRILQAISNDNILPKFFSKVSGKNNEPRIAVITIYILAECALLIGKLDVIAPIASMFFIVSYAFINLAFVLEKASSTDFRPSFKLSNYIGIIGFIACLLVMFELNALAMVIALLLMSLLFLFIKRRKLQLDFGDVWQSVLLSITRYTLRKISERKLENRNWQPNVLVFSGGNNNRPYLIDFGKWLIGKHGFLSNFDVRENNIPYSINAEDALKEKVKDQWIEAKTYQCENLYDGIELLAKTYGFTGIEPNTVILGFDNSTKDPERFCKMLNNLAIMNKNILLMQFNNDNGFGNKKLIDIWITPVENENMFYLNIVKLLWTNPDWYQSTLRINIVTNNDNSYSFMYNKINTIINKVRIPADIRIINNEIDNKPVSKLIESHSNDSDLIFLAMNTDCLSPDNELIYYTKINKTIIFVSAVKEFLIFDNINIATENKQKANTDKLCQTLPVNPEAAEFVINLQDKIYNLLQKSTIDKVEAFNSYLLNTLSSIKHSLQINCHEPTTSFIRVTNTANILKTNISNFITNTINELNTLAKSIGTDLLSELNIATDNLPKHLTVLYNQDIACNYPEDSKQLLKLKTKIKKFYKHDKNKDILFPYKTNISEYVSFVSYFMFYDIINKTFNYIKSSTINYYYELSKIIHYTNDANNNSCNEPEIIGKYISSVENSLNLNLSNIQTEIGTVIKEHFNKISAFFNIVNFGDTPIDRKALPNNALDIVNENYDILAATLPYLYNRLIVNIDLNYVKTRLHLSLIELNNSLDSYTKNFVIYKHKKFLDSLVSSTKIESIDVENLSDTENIFDLFSTLNETSDKISKVIQEQTNTLQILDNKNAIICEQSNNELPSITECNVPRYCDFLIQSYYFKNIRTIIETFYQYCLSSLLKHKPIVTRLSLTTDYQSFIKDISTSINEEINLLSQKLSETITDVHGVYELTYEKLQLENFVDNTNIKIGAISNDKNKVLKIYENISSLLKDNITKLLYKNSSGINFKNYLIERDNEQEILKQYFNAISKITLQPQSTISKYTQLFTGYQRYHKDLWIGRAKELNDFSTLFSQYLRLRFGAIIVIGYNSSGKSFFSYHAAKSALPNSTIYSIKSVSGGSASIPKFERAFLNSIDASAENSSIFKVIENIPKGSVFIFENIEQWWHRNENGSKVIDVIISLIETYSKDYVFIINANEFGFNAMYNITNIKNVLIGSVHLKPLNSEEIKNIILRRHNASSMKFILDGKAENMVNSWSLAKLFNNYYKLSRGNIGSALQLWIACIYKATNDYIYIHEPSFPTNIPIQLLSKQQIIFLAQFIIHNNMSFERILAIDKRSLNEVKQDITVLMRFGLLEKIYENIYGVSTVLYPFIIDELKLLEIL